MFACFIWCCFRDKLLPKGQTGFGFYFLSISEDIAVFKYKLKEAEFGVVSQESLDPIGPPHWCEPLSDSA